MDKLTKIILIRHGQTDWNIAGRYQGQADIALSDVGIKQAEILAQNFPVKKIDAIYSSDLKRAHFTANKIGEKFDVNVKTVKAFREICFGDWEGLTYEQITKKWPIALNNFFQAPDILEIPNGETFVEVQKRAMAALHEIIDQHNDSTVVIVSHGAILRTVIAGVLHTPLKYLWSFRQENTAVNIFTYNEGYFMVDLLNSTAHLQGTEYQILTKI